MADLTTQIGPIKLPNPVLAASGTFGYGLEFEDFVDLSRIGAVVVKGLSLEPWGGNRPPRVIETASGMLNSIGLQNIGMAAFAADKLPRLRELGARVIVNFWGETTEQYAELAGRLGELEGLIALEANISCPNHERGGIHFGTDPGTVRELTAAVRKATALPLIVKLSPNVTDIRPIAIAAQEGGADAVSLINTLTGMAVDLESRRPVLGGVTGGLSGPAIKPVALRMVWEAAGAVEIPVIGMGGIATGRDALEFMMVGATAVQVGTATFADPSAPIRIIAEMSAALDELGLKSASEIVGTIQR